MSAIQINTAPTNTIDTMATATAITASPGKAPTTTKYLESLQEVPTPPPSNSQHGHWELNGPYKPPKQKPKEPRGGGFETIYEAPPTPPSKPKTGIVSAILGTALNSWRLSEQKQTNNHLFLCVNTLHPEHLTVVKVAKNLELELVDKEFSIYRLEQSDKTVLIEHGLPPNSYFLRGDLDLPIEGQYEDGEEPATYSLSLTNETNCLKQPDAVLDLQDIEQSIPTGRFTSNGSPNADPDLLKHIL